MQHHADVEVRCAGTVEALKGREMVVEDRLGVPVAERSTSNGADLQ